MTFRYLNEGKLFRLELDSVHEEGEWDGSMQLEEYFWLCDRCCLSYKLQLDPQGNVVAVSLPRLPKERQLQVCTISRAAGKLLRSVGAFRKRDHTPDPLERSSLSKKS